MAHEVVTLVLHIWVLLKTRMFTRNPIRWQFFSFDLWKFMNHSMSSYRKFVLRLCLACISNNDSCQTNPTFYTVDLSLVPKSYFSSHLFGYVFQSSVPLYLSLVAAVLLDTEESSNERRILKLSCTVIVIVV